MTHELDLLPPSEELLRYLPDFAARHPFEEIAGHLERARELRALVVGEAIIDEYQYVDTIGKSGKEPVLVARYISTEKFAGGSLAVANHVASVTESVNVVCELGAHDSHEQFIRASLDRRVEPRFVFVDDAPTIVKRRFVEAYPLQKLFEVYVMNGDDHSPEREAAFSHALEESLPDADVVIVADYGHGMLGADAVELLCSQARFLAVNTQMNADNRGFNTISKYRRGDYVCVSENELRLELRNRRHPLREIVADVADRLECKRMLVTRGGQGVFAYDVADGAFEIPGFAGRIVDRVGAGDAVLAVTALCAALDAPIEVIAMVGNAVGAQAVGTVGNSAAVDAAAVLAHLESVLASV